MKSLIQGVFKVFQWRKHMGTIFYCTIHPCPLLHLPCNGILHWYSDPPSSFYFWEATVWFDLTLFPPFCALYTCKAFPTLQTFSPHWEGGPCRVKGSETSQGHASVLSCIWTDSESKESCQWHLSTGRTIMDLFSDTQSRENHWPQTSATG